MGGMGYYGVQPPIWFVNGIVEQIPPLSIYPSWNSWKPKIKGLKRLFSRTPAKKFGVTTQVSCVNLAGLENPQ